MKTGERKGRHHATVRILGEGVIATLDVPEGATAGDLIRAAGSAPREQGWDLFLDGAPASAGTPIPRHDVSLAYVPRTRGG